MPAAPGYARSMHSGQGAAGRATRGLLYGVFALSGAAALGYEMAWVRMFAPGLGHELPGVLAVVGAYFLGLATGAWALDSTISSSRYPGRWAAALEAIIGAWALVTIGLIPLLNDAAAKWIGIEGGAGRHWTIALLIPLLAIGPATAAMGATLTAMDRMIAPLTGDHRVIGGLYAANTLGAIAGTLAVTFVLGPVMGFRATLCVLSGVSFLCAAALWRRVELRDRGSEGPRDRAEAAAIPNLPRARLIATLFITGLLGIGYQAAGVRVLGQVLQSTVYTFAATVAVFLLGTAIGAAIYQRFLRRRPANTTLTLLVLLLAASCALGRVVVVATPSIDAALASAFGDAWLGAWAAEMLTAGAVFVLPTVCMGAMFSHLVQCSRGEASGVGQAAAINTLGAAAGPAVFGAALPAMIGPAWAMSVIVIGYLLLIPRVTLRAAASASLIAVAVIMAPSLDSLTTAPPNGRLIEVRHGVMATVAVIEQSTPGVSADTPVSATWRSLKVNNRFAMGGTGVGAEAGERLQAHVPLLLHPAPRRALFLGIGTGITFGAAAMHPGVEADGVELLPEVADAMPRFAEASGWPWRDEPLRVHVADARRYVRASPRRYDVIVADLFHPARDGAAGLYTLEHFRAVRRRLENGGLFCQWLPLHQIDGPTLKVIIRSFLDVFPHTQAYLSRFDVDTPTLGLIGLTVPPAWPTDYMSRRGSDARLAAQLASMSLTRDVQLFGRLAATGEQLRRYAGEGPLNTDDRPIVLFAAPRFAYQREGDPHERLFDLLTFAAASGDSPDNLKPFIAARDAYLHGLVSERQGRTGEAIDRYIQSAALSGDFTAGYARCLYIAHHMARDDPAGAKDLLQRLIDAQPGNPVAKRLIEQLP